MAFVPLPSEIAADLLFAAQRTCCVCRVFGKPVQLHHIDGDHSHNAIDNLAILCLECRHQTQIQGGLARHLSQLDVTNYRNDWQSRVQNRRARAAALAVEVIVGLRLPKQVQRSSSNRPSLPVEDYIRTLPALRKRAYAVARTESDSGRSRSVEGAFAIIDAMEDALTVLGSYFPKGHFGSDNLRDYVSELLATRLCWHHNRHQSPGSVNESTALNALVAESVVADIERMVVELVESLTPDSAAANGSAFANWKKEWDASQHLQPSIEVAVSSGKRAVVRVTNRGEAFTLSMRGQLVKSNSAIEHSDPFEFLPRRVGEADPITNYTIATVDAYGVVALYGEHLGVIQTWRLAGTRKLRFRLALTFVSDEQRRPRPVSKCQIEIECDPKAAKLKARLV